jgi:hypothetical protein
MLFGWRSLPRTFGDWAGLFVLIRGYLRGVFRSTRSVYGATSLCVSLVVDGTVVVRGNRGLLPASTRVRACFLSALPGTHTLSTGLMLAQIDAARGHERARGEAQFVIREASAMGASFIEAQGFSMLGLLELSTGSRASFVRCLHSPAVRNQVIRTSQRWPWLGGPERGWRPRWSLG